MILDFGFLSRRFSLLGSSTFLQPRKMTIEEFEEYRGTGSVAAKDVPVEAVVTAVGQRRNRRFDHFPR